ncbi:18495_t:CDS:2 [Gigaspora margarita]|uniref:18495_t:CDS:1 n=1 Tax=Gigaspora margarita TaxID=4874 RepID=A0ABN7UNR5_GIGMA|nr:18495_t:CDS:2 [Gigaspora margarita]
MNMMKSLNQTCQNDKKNKNEKVEFELSALKNTMNIWNNSSRNTLEKTTRPQKPLTNVIEPEPTMVTSTQVEQTIEQETIWEPY